MAATVVQLPPVMPPTTPTVDLTDPLDPAFSVDEYLKSVQETEEAEAPVEETGEGEIQEAAEEPAASASEEEEAEATSPASATVAAEAASPTPAAEPRVVEPSPAPDVSAIAQRAYEAGRAEAQIEAERNALLLNAEIRRLRAAQREEKTQA